MKLSKCVGKALILALSCVPLAACDRGGNSTNQPGSAASSAQLEWTRKAERQLQEAIAQAPANGLKPELFLKGELPGDDAQRYAMLTQAALHYAEALAHGYADPTKLHDVYAIPRPSDDLRPGLTQALQDGKVGEWLASLPPQTDEYRALSKAFLHYLQLAARDQFQPVPEGKPIKPGHHDPRIPAVAAALRAVGYLPSQPQQPAAPRAATLYSPDLVAAVRTLQAEFGFKIDGVIGGDTLDAINAGPGYRARQLAIAMERLRWLQRDPPPTRIDVNTAASFLDYWRDGQLVDRRKVVNGEPDKPTPQLQAPIVQLVAYPIWRIPDSIVKEELADKSRAYLAENDMEYRNGRLVQVSGPKNSLGIVKFDMDDKQQIYLHDTPAKPVFALPDRHRSHGCVRVENAVQFATALAAEQGVLDQFQQAMTGQEESFVKLKRKIPVRLLYHSAFWDGSRIQFRQDAYGWDDNVARALELAPGPPRKIRQPQDGDIGP